MFETKQHSSEKAVFVGIIKQNDDEAKIMEYLDELEFLAETAGAIGDIKFVQKVDKPEKATYIRSGKLAEIHLLVERDEFVVSFRKGVLESFDNGLDLDNRKVFEKCAESA